MQLTKRIFLALALILPFSAPAGGQESGSGTFMYSRSDSTELFLNFIAPAGGNRAGKAAPLVIFISEEAHDASAWLQGISGAGYAAASVGCREIPDWKGAGNKQKAAVLSQAVQSISEDLCTAVRYLVENAAALGIDTQSFVLAGASTGAVAALQTEWEICNGARAAALLPQGFRFAGIISFAGALAEGSTRYSKAPAPTMFVHGTTDKQIGYEQTKSGKLKFPGSSTLAREYASKGYTYWILRFEGKGHEISESMKENLPETLRFLECNVAGGERRVVDATVIL